LAKPKYYVVWTGRRTGVYSDWPTAHAQVDKFAGARFKSFNTRAEADQAFSGGRPSYAATRAPARKSAARAPSRGELGAFEVQIYCDGACEPNPGRAGSGLAVYHDGKLAQLWYGLFNPRGTNNTAELNALHRALQMAEEHIQAGESVQILCDSTYAINCVSKWASGWEKRGWRKADGEIKNLEIIKAAHAIYCRIASELTLTHVSAHVGTEGNELADRMAMLAVESGDAELRRYEEALDVPAILKMRAG
jgi:ribonuclease HI